MKPCAAFNAFALFSFAICAACYTVRGYAETFNWSGSYERITQSPKFQSGGRGQGLLTVGRVADGRAPFNLEVTFNPLASDDGFLTRNGVIDDGVFEIKGRSAVYRSNYPEDKDLGTCVINAKVVRQDLVLSQGGNCYWFGQDVDASGLYRRTTRTEPRVVN